MKAETLKTGKDTCLFLFTLFIKHVIMRLMIVRSGFIIYFFSEVSEIYNQGEYQMLKIYDGVCHKNSMLTYLIWPAIYSSSGFSEIFYMRSGRWRLLDTDSSRGICSKIVEI